MYNPAQVFVNLRKIVRLAVMYNFMILYYYYKPKYIVIFLLSIRCLIFHSSFNINIIIFYMYIVPKYPHLFFYPNNYSYRKTCLNNLQ